MQSVNNRSPLSLMSSAEPRCPMLDYKYSSPATAQFASEVTHHECDIKAWYVLSRPAIGNTSKEPVCPRVELILKIIIILLIIFLGFIKSKPC